MSVNPFDQQSIVEFIDKEALSAARIKDSCPARKTREVLPNPFHLRQVGRVELPIGRQLAMVVTALGILPRSRDRRPGRFSAVSKCGAVVREQRVAGRSLPAGARSAPESRVSRG